MVNRIQIILEAQDRASGVFANTVKSFLTSAAVLGTIQKVAEDSYKAYSKLSESVRDLSLVSGESAESTSRFIQVLDDFQLTAEDAMTASKALKEKGLSPNIETLAQLSDEFQKINDPAERMVFIQENLGRGGAKWVNVLNQGGDALRAMSNEVSKNLILTEKQIKQYEVQRLALDNLSDKWEGFKVQVGATIGTMVANSDAANEANRRYQEQYGVINQAAQGTKEYQEILRQVKEDQLQAAGASIEQSESLAELELAAAEAAEAIKLVSEANQSLLGVIGNLQSATETYNEQYQSIANDMSLSDDERIAKINEVKEQYEIAKLEIISGLAERKLMEDGILTDDEVNWLINKREEWGIYSEDVAQKARDMIVEVDALTASIANVPTEHTTVFNLVTNGAPPNLDISGTSDAPVGTRRGGRDRAEHAAGGSFIIPMSYGNEGFMLGDGDSASGGERLILDPNGSNGGISQADINKIISAILSIKPDYYKIAQINKEVMLQGNR